MLYRFLLLKVIKMKLYRQRSTLQKSGINGLQAGFLTLCILYFVIGFDSLSVVIAFGVGILGVGYSMLYYKAEARKRRDKRD